MRFASIGAPISLANLPHDIIRRILPIEESALDSMRLISPPWNALVKQYMSDHDRRVPLERVYFFAGVTLTDEQPERVSMYAIMPEEYASRVGYRRWLHCQDRHSGGIIELRCAPRNIAGNFPFYKVAVNTAGFLFPSILIGIFYSIIPAVIIALIVLAVSFCFVLGFVTECDHEKRARARFTRFFTNFSTIETLVLGNLWNTQTFAAVNSTLANIPIARLEYRVPYVGPDSRKQILKLISDHGIRHVSITADTGSAIDIRKLAHDLVSLGVTLDMFETTRFTIQGHFGQPRVYWAELESELAERDMLMRMTTIHDPRSARTSFHTNTKSHIQIAPVGSNYQATQSRGYVNK